MKLHDILTFIQKKEQEGKKLPDYVVAELLELVKE